MITYLDKTISLANLPRATRGGQVATILLFLMVVVLVFILVTANIGHLAVTTTNLANTADSASLYLASQLATRSALLSKAVDKDSKDSLVKKYKERGLGGTLGGLIGSIIAIALPATTAGASLNPTTFIQDAATQTLTIAMGGAIGGAVGGAIAGPAAAQGVLQGVETGFAIGRAIRRAADIARDIAKTIK